ncbi:putative NSF attachment protein [Helianthus debilis subsp. tardiflorus]
MLAFANSVKAMNAMEHYQVNFDFFPNELDPTFSGTCEYKLLADMATAMDEEDVAKFTDVVK